MAHAQTPSSTQWLTGAVSLYSQLLHSWSAVGETAVASAHVVGARLPIIESALRNPLAANLPELLRMGSEKHDAMSQSAPPYWLAIADINRSIVAQWVDFGSTMGRGRLMNPEDVGRLMSRSVSIAKAIVRANDQALDPFHKRATGNAARLRKS